MRVGLRIHGSARAADGGAVPLPPTPEGGTSALGDGPGTQPSFDLRLTRRSLLLAAMGGAAVAALPGAAGSARAAPRAVPWWPPIVPRTEWDGGACQPTGAPDVGPPVQRVVVHHTAIFPRYAPGEAPAAIRQMCINHIRDRKFSDIAYHLLIDRYGVIYQGRAGSMLAPIVGAHAQGFNKGSVGVALIGNFSDEPIPDPMQKSLVRTIAWLSQLHGFDPGAVSPHTSTGGPSSLIEEGRTVALPGIIPHRRVAPSDCPGAHAARYVNSGKLLEDVRHEIARRPEAAIPAAEEVARSAGRSDRAPVDPGRRGRAPADPGEGSRPVEKVVDRIVGRLVPPRRGS